jgi:histidinol-phosphate phosphatase family protein
MTASTGAVSDRPSQRVIVLDRDGTLVIDRGYLNDPDGLAFLPGVPEALRWWREHGYRLVVISNQSGIGRGLISAAQMAAMNARLEAMATNAGAPLAGIYVCPHRPEEGCACRKPAQQLLEAAAADLSVEARHCVVIGDKASDIELGARAGARSILIAPAPAAAAARGAAALPPTVAAPATQPAADLVVSSLLEAAHAVTERGW